MATKKKALPCQSTDRAHWSNALMSARNASMQQSGSIDSALIQWHTGIVRLTVMFGIQWCGSHISGWPCHSLSQPCYNVVSVRAVIGAPSAGGTLGHRLARLCLETVLCQHDKCDISITNWNPIRLAIHSSWGSGVFVQAWTHNANPLGRLSS